jgi:hypothetical protein
MENPKRTIHFGSKTSVTYVEGASKEDRLNYLKRHKVRENWNETKLWKNSKEEDQAKYYIVGEAIKMIHCTIDDISKNLLDEDSRKKARRIARILALLRCLILRPSVLRHKEIFLLGKNPVY